MHARQRFHVVDFGRLVAVPIKTNLYMLIQTTEDIEMGTAAGKKNNGNKWLPYIDRPMAMATATDPCVRASKVHALMCRSSIGEKICVM